MFITWKTCPHCHVDFPIERGERPPTVCPGCAAAALVAIPVPPAPDASATRGGSAANDPSSPDGRQHSKVRTLAVGAGIDPRHTITYARESAEHEPGLPAIAGYEVLGELGRGGMGVVYKARDLELKRVIALKMIRGGAHAGSDELTRFRAEAEAVARLQHPHVVQVHEIGEHGGLPYLSLEFVGGGSLKERLAGTPQPPREAAALVETLARAMGSAHQAGIVHRDLKPGNILLTPDGTPKISDFGLAKKFDDDSGQTRTGEVLGSPSYMAPEQAAGRTRAIGPLTDVYALGAILYECLTGRPPFKGTDIRETLEQVCTSDPVPPSRFQRRLPRDLETICLKCLEKDPARRYGSATLLADDLGRFLGGEPIAARPVRLWERGVRWAKRRPAVAALGALLVVAIVGGYFAILWQLRKTEQARRDADDEAVRASKAEREAHDEALRANKAEKEAKANAATAQARERDAVVAQGLANQAAENRRRDLYVAHMNLVQRAWERSDILHVEELLRRQLPQPGQADLREFEWYYYQGMTQHGHVLRNLPGVRALAWSPDSKTLAIGCASWGGASVYLWDAVRRTPPVLLAKSKLFAVNALAFNDAGTMLAVGLGTFWGAPEIRTVVPGVIEVWHLPVSIGDLKAPSRLARTLSGHKYPVMGLAFTRDGGLVSVGADIKDGQGGAGPVRIYAWDKNARGEIKLWDVNAGKEISRFPTDLPAVTAMTLALDGRRLVTGGLDGRVTVWAIEKGTEVNRLSIPGMPIWALALDNMGDAGHLAVGAGYLDRGALRIWDLSDTAKEPRLLTGHSAGIFCLSYGPNFLLSSGFDRTTKRWQGDSEITTFRGHNAFILAQALAPDGRSVATGGLDQTVRIWDMQTEWQEFAGLGQGEFEVSPDGTHLLINNEGGSTMLDLQTRRALWGRSGAHTASRAFSQNGKHVWLFGDKGGAMLDARTGESLAAAERPGPLGKLPPGGVLILGVMANSSAHKAGLKRGDVLLRYAGAEVASLNEVIKQIQANSGMKEVTLTVWRDGKTETCQAAPGVLGISVHERAAPLALRSMSPDEKLVLNAPGESRFQVISPDGKWLAGGGAYAAYSEKWSTVKLWDRTTGKLEAELLDPRGGGIWGLCFSPDSKRLVSTGLVNLTVWDLASKKPLKTFWRKRGAYLKDPTFSRDGKLVAAGDDAVEDGTLQGFGGRVHLYDMEKLVELPSLRGHGDVVDCVAFSPDGRTLVSGSWDRQIKIWDLVTGEERMTMHCPVGIPRKLQFGLGGQVLIVRDSANNVIAWRALRGTAAKSN